jgi:4'-phosphopantetheinyl transferase
MPVFKIFTLGEDCLWGIWKIEQQESMLLNSLTHFSYPDAFSAITHPKKKLEWLSSRLLMKALLENIGKPFFGIVNDGYGKPHLAQYNYHVSLSHCGDFSTAILHKKKNVGIDIEFLKEKLRLVIRKFLSDIEIADIQSDLRKLCVYWCVKEVIYKLHGTRSISLKNNIYIHPFIFNPEGGQCVVDLSYLSLFETFQVRYLSIDDYYIAFNL